MNNPNQHQNDQTTPQTPNQQRPPTDNERKGGPEQSQDDKVRRSNLAGDQDTEAPVDTESVDTEEGPSSTDRGTSTERH